MVGRLGDVIYWAGTLIAVPLATLALYGAFLGSGGDPFMQTAALVLAAAIWLAGRALRYVLKG